tara:strand:+ start:946 stop:1764 length:819 start_codon:yes stop_codon:yes gene_type:complete
VVELIFIFLFGSCVGSFLNVIFYRFPIEKSFIYSQSECTSCNLKIQFRDLVPIFSWIFLGGKCRFCKSRIPVTYPLIELITALSWLSINLLNPTSTRVFEPNLAYILNSFLISLVIIIFYFDFNYLWIPKFSLDLFLMSGIIFLVLKLINGLISSNIFIFNLCSYFLFFVAFELMRKLGKYFYKKDVLGKGDSYIVSSNALLIGLKGNLVALLISFVLASLIEVLIRLFNKKIKTNQFALGPYLLIGFLIVWTFGYNPIWITWQNFITNLFI